MFRENKKLIYLFLGLTALVLLLQYLLPGPTDWSRNYLAKNKSPFGCYAIYNLLEKVYAPQLNTNKQTLYNLNNRSDTAASLLIVNDKINFNENDLKYLYAFLNRGNTVFLAANEFYGALNDSLHLRMYTPFFFDFTAIDSLAKKPGAEIRFFANNLQRKKFRYTQLAAPSYFTGFDSTRFKVTASMEGNKPCLLKAKVKSGTLYVMSMPDAFGNYFIADHPNREMAYTCLSLLKNETLYWDEYYKTFNVTNYSPFRFIFQSDALYTAYLLIIFIIILYMIFEGRRRQRVIPALPVVTNTTLDFVNVISHVYYNPRNHKSIALEKIKYFYEILRKKFRVSTAEINDDLYRQLAELSGIELKQVSRLLQYCENLKQSEAVTEFELMELNRQIENFNKHSLR